MASGKRKKMLPGLETSFKTIYPKTGSQEDMFEAYHEGYNLLLQGVAGTGKTFTCLWLSLRDLLAGKYDKIIIVRSTVPSRDMGHLPGTMDEKSAPYEEVYVSMVNFFFGRNDAWQLLIEKGMIEFRTTAHLRSLTFDNSIIIVDEIQNLNFQELDTIATRVGKDTKIIFCGDIYQNDLYRSKYDVTGLPNFVKILEGIDSFDIIDFGVEDIVRSGFVKDYITQKIKLGLA